MVKLELGDSYGTNGVAFVDPVSVVGIRSFGATTTSIERGSGLRELIVNGTPDEVHAKLFPKAAPEDVDWRAVCAAYLVGDPQQDATSRHCDYIWSEPAAIHVLRWVLAAKDLAGLPPVIIEKARKALNREET